MSPSETAIIVVLLMVPVLVSGRLVYRRNRGEFDWRNDALFTAGVILIALVGAVIFANPHSGMMLALPLPILIGGSYLLFNAQRLTDSESNRRLLRGFGALALVTGSWWLVVALINPG